jgi:hypothetical protein
MLHHKARLGSWISEINLGNTTACAVGMHFGPRGGPRRARDLMLVAAQNGANKQRSKQQTNKRFRYEHRTRSDKLSELRTTGQIMRSSNPSQMERTSMAQAMPSLPPILPPRYPGTAKAVAMQLETNDLPSV